MRDEERGEGDIKRNVHDDSRQEDQCCNEDTKIFFDNHWKI